VCYYSAVIVIIGSLSRRRVGLAIEFSAGEEEGSSEEQNRLKVMLRVVKSQLTGLPSHCRLDYHSP
jgi:hypothetical protein